MELMIYLENLKQKAKADPALMQRILDTRKDPNSLAAFCALCRELGYSVYEMDLITAGEEFHAAMKRSTNGGGENSPKLCGEDDFYEMFFAELSV